MRLRPTTGGRLFKFEQGAPRTDNADQLAGAVVSDPDRINDRRALAAYAGFAAVVLGVLSVCYALGIDTFAARDRALRLIQPGLVTMLSFGFLLYVSRHPWPQPGIARLLRRPAPWPELCCVVLALAGTVAIATFVLQAVRLSGDEAAYVFQADLFTHGRSWMLPSAIQRYVSQAYIFVYDGKLMSQYPPGWPAVLAVAERVGVPLVLVNPILGALTIAALYRFALAQYGREVAVLAALATTVSAFFLFNSGSFYNGSLVALLGVLFVHSACSFISRPEARSAIGLGFWFSAIAVVRHYDAVLFAIPVAVALLWRSTGRHWRLVPIAALAAVPLMGLLLLYYWQLTGNPLLLPQQLQNPNDALLGANWHARRATEILVGRLVELAEWVSPPFVVVFAWALLQKLRGRALRFFDLYGIVFLAGYWLFWADGTLRYGPRYIYPSLPFMVLLVVERGWHARAVGPRRAALAHLAAISVVVSALMVPFLAARGRAMMTQTQDLYRQVGNAGLHDAVVIAATGTGLIWRIDPADMTRNGPTLDRDVVYAHGPGMFVGAATPEALQQTIDAMRARFPARQIWIYRKDENAAEGTLVRV